MNDNGDLGNFKARFVGKTTDELRQVCRELATSVLIRRYIELSPAMYERGSHQFERDLVERLAEEIDRRMPIP